MSVSSLFPLQFCGCPAKNLFNFDMQPDLTVEEIVLLFLLAVQVSKTMLTWKYLFA